MPNLFFVSRDGKKFSNVTMAGRLGHLQKGHGVVFADLDHDGDLDIFMEMGGAFPGDKFFDAMFENPGFGNNFVSIKLEGIDSNRSAIGSRIRVDVEEDGKSRSIFRTVNSGGSFGANPLRQHIGLGKATVAKQIEIYWPKSDTKQVFENVDANQLIRIKEHADKFENCRTKKSNSK